MIALKLVEKLAILTQSLQLDDEEFLVTDGLLIQLLRRHKLPHLLPRRTLLVRQRQQRVYDHLIVSYFHCYFVLVVLILDNCQINF